MMYQAGLLPIEVIYEYFLKADVIPEYVTLEMFQKMLDDAKQFPNNPDFESRKEGFPDAGAQRDDELQRDLADLEDDQHANELQNEAGPARRRSLSITPRRPPRPARRYRTSRRSLRSRQRAQHAMNKDGQGTPSPAEGQAG
jgi:hypothetical protein